MLCPRSVFDAEVVLLKCHFPAANEGLISRIGFQPRQCLIVASQSERSWAQIAVVLHNEVVGGVHF